MELCPHARYTAARLYQSSLLVQPVERLPLLLQLRLLQRLRLLQLRRSPAGVEGRAGLAPPAFRTPHSRTAALLLLLPRRAALPSQDQQAVSVGSGDGGWRRHWAAGR